MVLIGLVRLAVELVEPDFVPVVVLVVVPRWRPVEVAVDPPVVLAVCEPLVEEPVREWVVRVLESEFDDVV